MTIADFLQELQWVARGRHAEDRLMIKVFAPGNLGGIPCVEVAQVAAGFDWNNGQIILTPAEPLTKLTAEQVSAITMKLRDEARARLKIKNDGGNMQFRQLGHENTPKQIAGFWPPKGGQFCNKVTAACEGAPR